MKVIKSTILVASAGAVALLLLSLFVLVYNYTGVHIGNPSGATDYKWSSGQLKSNMMEGFSWFRMDDNGFHNSIVVENPDILIMGSSHMEAVSVGGNNCAEYLRMMMPEYTVYNIGMSGHTIYTCAKDIPNAVLEYAPRRFVIIETSTVSLDEVEMQKVLDGAYQSIPSYDNGLLYLVQKYCPAVKTLYKNIVDAFNSENRSPAASHSDVEAEQAASMSADTLTRFLKSIRTPCGDNCKLIILFHPDIDVDKSGCLEFRTDRGELELFSAACQENDIVFLDVSDAFSALYEETHTLPYGFANTAVGAGHLNEHGHRVIAESLAQVIKEQ